jgi:predicted phage-related endonuclease
MVASVYREHSPAWLAEHLRTIGGSNAGAVLGQSRFKKPWQVWDAMHGVIVEGKQPSPSRVSDDMRRGAILEPVARLLLAEYLGVPIAEHDQHQFVYRADMPWAHTLPDGWIATKLPVELKVPRPGTVTRCNLQGLIPEWWIQGQHTLALTDQEVCHFGLLDPITCGIHHFEVYRDDAFVSRIMEAEARFFESITAGKRPEEDEADAIEGGGALLILEDDQAKAIAKAFNSLRAIAKETDESIDEAKAKLRELAAKAAGSWEGFEVPGVLRVYDRVCGGSEGKPCIDADKLKQFYPEAHADKRVWGKSGARKASRRFMSYNLESQSSF